MRFIVIGAGMAGVLAAIKLKEAGFSQIAVYEKGDTVGGTWRENRYPGLTCDVAAHAYTYTFERNPDWSQMFAPGPEIHQYFIRTADKYDVTKLIHFGEEVSECLYDGGKWHIKTKKGTEDWADFVIAASGVLHHPNIPHIKGMETFEGAMFHTARWDQSVALDGKRVAVIGTGSTGIQIVTALQPVAAKVYQVQRTAQWVTYLPSQTYTEEEKQRFRDQPELIEELADQWLNGEFTQMFLRGLVNESSSDMHMIEDMCKEVLEGFIADPALREKLLPNYRAACKRLVMSPDYFNAVQKDNVEVVTDKIEQIEKSGIRFESGKFIEVDLIALATGFDVAKFIRPTRVVGLNGVDLGHIWTPDPKAYGALAVPGFPNFFFLNGPNGPVGNFPLIDTAERQMGYILQAISVVGSGACKALHVTQAAFEAFDMRRREAAKKTIWASGCKSWYLDSTGVPSIWTLSNDDFVEMNKKPKWQDYEFLDAAGQRVDIDPETLFSSAA
jgi:cation diffusion facilitator CzcD-associated flavoprotein CzcO